MRQVAFASLSPSFAGPLDSSTGPIVALLGAASLAFLGLAAERAAKMSQRNHQSKPSVVTKSAAQGFPHQWRSFLALAAAEMC